jgi:uridine phosphorylase
MNKQLVSAKQYLTNKGITFTAPKRVIIGYAYSLGLVIVKEGKFQKNTKWKRGELYTNKDNTTGIILNIGLGSPVLAMCLHELKILGVKEVIMLGIAGSISDQHIQGDIIKINSAFAEDGVSIHYGFINGDKYSTKYPLKLKGIQTFEGSCVSMSAPYMEDKKFIDRFLNKVDCVDMETSALFAICNHLKLKCVSYLVINDILKKNNWVFPSDTTKTKESYLNIFRRIISI